jgi:hypothetical protein
MASVQVNTNGQTLTVNASISHWTTAALAVTASGTNDVESTTTTTITSDYTMHFSNTATTAVITIKQRDGTTLLAQTFDVSVGTGPRVLNPLPDEYQQAADLSTAGSTFASSLGGVLTAGEGNMDRMTNTLVNTDQSATGTLYLRYFTAQVTETITKMAMYSGTTAAAATPTLVRMGVFSVDSVGDGTLLSSHVSDTALFATGNTRYEKTLTTPVSKVRGQRYATGVLVVSAGACPTFYGRLHAGATAAGTMLGQAPRVCGDFASQTDMPASFTEAGLANDRRDFYAELLR